MSGPKRLNSHEFSYEERAILCTPIGKFKVKPMWQTKEMGLRGRSLAENLLHDFAMHVGESVISALEAEGKTGVVEAEQM
jgi:hypothetical protein